MVIRKAEVWDAQQITALWAKMHHEITKRPAMLKEVSDIKKAFLKIIVRIESEDVWSVLVAEENGTIIGFIMGFIHWPEYSQSHLVGTCEALYVVPKYRENGIHKELIGKLHSWGKGKGAKEIEFIGIFDSTYIRFWDKLGYEPVQVVYRQKEA